MYFKKENILFLSFITLISTLIIAFMMYLSQDCCFWSDDSVWAIYRPEESLFSCLFGDRRLDHGGYYIGGFLCKFLSFALPNLLSIHPADFITYGHGCIKGIYVVIVMLLMTKFSVFYKKSKLILCTTFLFLTCYFFYNAIQCFIILISYNFYRYIFSLIFFSIFWYYILTNILLPPPESKNRKYKKLNLIGVTICGFILGTSIEISFYASAFLAFLIVFYNNILNLFSFIMKNKNILIHKYNLGLNFYVPILGLLCGIILFVTNPGSIEVAKNRSMANIYIDLDILKEYSQLYFQRCFAEHIIYWIIFLILLCISFYRAFRKQEIKDVIFPLLMQLSILTVMFSLILCGKTGYDNDFWINSHYNILLLYKIIIMFPFLMYFNYAITKISLNYKNITLYSAIILILVSCFTVGNIQKYLQSEDTKTLFKQLETGRRTIYVTDKIFRFYAEKNEKPILPPDVFINTSHWICRFTYPYHSYYQYFHLGIQVIEYNTSIRDSMVDEYMSKIYNDTKRQEYEIRENAVDLFYKNGGTFTEEELKHIRFSKLFDSKFVLNENTK